MNHKNHIGDKKSMKNISMNKFILFVASLLFFTGIASANMGSSFNASNNNVQRITYTAQGTTDIRTAMMLKKLLKSTRDLEVDIRVKRYPLQRMGRKVKAPMNYTVSGKTDIKTIRKLMKLFKSTKHVQVTVQANANFNSTNNSQISHYRNYNQQGSWNNTQFTGYQPAYDNYGYTTADYIWDKNKQYGEYQMPVWNQPVYIFQERRS